MPIFYGVAFLLWSCRSKVYRIGCQSFVRQKVVEKNFPKFVACLLLFLIVSFDEQKLLILMMSNYEMRFFFLLHDSDGLY